MGLVGGGADVSVLGRGTGVGAAGRRGATARAVGVVTGSGEIASVLLGQELASAGGGALGGRTTTAAAASAAAAFHGAHQAGITQDVQTSSVFLSFDVTAADRRELVELLHTLTERARFLTTGGTPAALGITDSPSDSGTLGPNVPGDHLTVTTGVGASLFDARFGLKDHKPLRLTPMPAF